MSEQFDVERVSDHEFRIRTEAEGQAVESLLRMNPDLQEQLGLPDTDEVTIVQATARFLATHQSVIDFPPMIDLEDILATYDDFTQHLHDEIERGH